MKKNAVICGIIVSIQFATLTAQAWDYTAHRAINELALTTLPADFPAFVKTPAARDRGAPTSAPGRGRRERRERQGRRGRRQRRP